MPARKPVAVTSPTLTDGGGHTRTRAGPPPTGKKPAIKSKSPVVDLLGDDGSTSMGGWEALKPS